MSAFAWTDSTRDFALRDIGCIACWLRKQANAALTVMAAAKHHLLTTGFHGNGKRRGEKFTVPLCDYHHQGASQVGTAFAVKCRDLGYGPSYADQPAAFRREFSDDILLDATERALADWRAKTV